VPAMTKGKEKAKNKTKRLKGYKKMKTDNFTFLRRKVK
jgi:hypothetical protein